MNKSKVVPLILLVRGISSGKSFDPFAGIRGKMKIMRQNESGIDMEGFDIDDASEFEADFMNVDESHKVHEREIQRQKEMLKQQIVNQKYFQEKEPRFLTYAEKKLICKLYNTKPEEWTVEKLSESFPALPETIKKILNSKWSPKSIKKVIQYDNIVAENWKKFHIGKLALSPKLSEHLAKFQSRKIILTDREQLAEQFVTSKPEFKTPKSQVFSSIIQTYLDKEQQTKANLMSQENSPDKITDTSNHSDSNQTLVRNVTNNASIAIRNPETVKLNKKQMFTLTTHIEKEYSNITPFKEKKKQKKPLTFDEFVKTSLNDIQKESPEDITLLNTYRQQIDANQEMQSAEVISRKFNNAVINTEENISSENIQRFKTDISNVSEQNNYNYIVMTDKLIDSNTKIWKKKIDTECNYAKPIKIAKHLYKPGKTYRIGDCYYDDDGEFLYRVPHVQS